MASINPPAVSPGDDTEATWANKVVTHVVDTFATVVERDQLIPAPDPGRVVYVESSKELQVWDSAAWVPVGSGMFLPLAGGTMTGVLSLESTATIRAVSGASTQVQAGVGASVNLVNDQGNAQIQVRETGDIVFRNRAGNEIMRWDESAEQFLFAQDIGGQLLVEVLKAQSGVRIGIFGDTSARMTINPGGNIVFLNSSGNETLKFDTAKNKWVFAVRPEGI